MPSAYEHFEAFVALTLTVLIAGVTLVDTLVLHSLNPLEHGVVQAVFGQILTVLAALEFNRTPQYVVTRERDDRFHLRRRAMRQGGAGE